MFISAPSKRCGVRLFALAATLVAVELKAQSILTVAGGGPIGDGRPATEALLREPWDTALDAAGNLYISDTKNHRVRRVDAKTGIITTFAGGGSSGPGDGGPATEAELPDPAGLAIDSEGTLYIGSSTVALIGSEQGAVRRVSPEGIITTYYGRADTVHGMAFDRDGNLHVPFRFTVRKIDRRTGAITTVAGSGAGRFSGDGGPALAAGMSEPHDLAFDRAGNLYIADTFNARVRRVDASTGIITTVAGNGSNMPFEPGKLATETNIGTAASIAFDADGNLFIGPGVIRVDARTEIATYTSEPKFFGRGGLTFDSGGNLLATTSRNLVQKKAGTSGIITTIAGGRSIGDGAPATSSSLFLPYELLALPNGDLVFTDPGWLRIRKLEASTGRVITIAGTGDPQPPFNFDGVPALQATFPPPLGLARDSSGNLYFSTTSAVLMKIDAATGILTRVAGAFPAEPISRDGLAVQPNGDIYIAVSENHRIRKIDAQTGIITTFAGSDPPTEGGFAGDGGPATNARLNTPRDVAFDGAGNLYISDSRNGRIRKVDTNGIITTIARLQDPLERLNEIEGIHSDAAGNLWFTLAAGGVRYFDARTGLVSIIAGSGRFTYNGDGGPARAAGLNRTTGVTVDARGTVFIADRANNRIRAVFACVALTTPLMSAPVDGASGIGTAPTLTWEKVEGAFRYDVYLSASQTPSQIAATDVTVTSFTPSNLLPGTKYYWRVVAKGDPFCPRVATASSEVRSFTTLAACEAPGAFNLTSPADSAADVSTNVSLFWSASPGAGTYDVLLGTSNPPAPVGITAATTFNATGLAAGTTYYWSVVARAGCDHERTTSTSVHSFRVAGGCPTPGAFLQTSPASGATNVSPAATLEWSASANATSYDLYLGTINPSPIYLVDLTATKVTISGLAPGANYSWRVVAKAACDVTRNVSTPISTFTVRTACTLARPTSFTFTPPGNVGVGQTYVVAWQDSQELDSDGFYIIERSQHENFATVLDTQQTRATSASFVASTIGAYYHRVRPVNPCSTSSTPSAARLVIVVPAPPNVIFTVQPEAVLTTLGQNIEDKQARFVVENIGTETISVLVGRQEIDSVPFFTVVDPQSGDSSILTLEPRKPKELELHFSGPPNDKPASYQGIIFLSATGKGLTTTPYAFVNLRVGGGDAAAPQFRRDATPTEYVSFPGFSGDDASRSPITVDIHNPGTTPMELVSEIGPEVWLVPESGWNSIAIPPSASRTVKLFTRRNRAANGSALPRYTYFTVRTKSGQTARLLVQDNDVTPTAAGRGAALDPSNRALLIPEVVSTNAQTFSTLRLSNLGSEAVQTELFFTPAGADGFDASRVRRATIVVPPNDVVTLTDLLAQLWGLAQPSRGQIEVRTTPEKIGMLAVRSGVTQFAATGGSTSYTVPAVGRGVGARFGSAHAVAGISLESQTKTSLTLAETSGTDRASARVTLVDANGSRHGERNLEVPRYGTAEIDDVAALLSAGASISGARLEIAVTSGGGSIIGVAKLLNRATGGGATLLSTTGEGAPLTLSAKKAPLAAAKTFFLPAAASGPVPGSTSSYRTVLGLVSRSDPTTFTLTYSDENGKKTAAVTVEPRKVKEYRNAIEELFGINGSTQGSMTVEASANSDVYAQLTSTTTSSTAIQQTLPVIGSDSEFVTSATSRRPLYLDGLEQSIDSSRGSRWSLVLNEIGGSSGSVSVRLYEAGNRSTPIAEKTFDVPSVGRLNLDIFAAMGLSTVDRSKDRANVLLSVVHQLGAGSIAAIAQAFDNRTGDSKSYILTPAGGSLTISKVVAVAPPEAPPRRRPSRSQ